MQTPARRKPNGDSLALFLLRGPTDGTASSRVPGTVPYVRADEIETFFQPSLREVLVTIFERTYPPDVAVALAQRDDHIEKAYREIRSSLRAEYQRIIDGDISIEKMRGCYHEVVRKIVDKALADNQVKIAEGKRPLFTTKVVESMQAGKILATEDFKKCLETDLDNFYQQVAVLPDGMGEGRLLKSTLLEQAVKDFQTRFDEANIMFMDLLELRDTSENDVVLNKRVSDRLSEAVRFLEAVHKSAHAHQLNKQTATGGERPKVFVVPRPGDLAQKRLFDLAETLFYPDGSFAIGKERQFIAQQIIVLTLIYNKIHQWPAFMSAREVVRRLNNMLNYNFDPEVGREGLPVRSVYVDKHDALTTLASESNFELIGFKYFKLAPRVVFNKTTQKEEVLFPDGVRVIINGRVKGADSTVLKYLNKGKFDICDLAAFEFAIDTRVFNADGTVKMVRTKKGMREKHISKVELAQRVRDLKRYLMSMWGVETLHENLTPITGDKGTDNSEANPLSAKGFVAEKIVFHKGITMPDGSKITVPVEVQIKALNTKLRADSATGEVAHRTYKERTALKIFKQLFPPEVFGAAGHIAGEVAGNVMVEGSS